MALQWFMLSGFPGFSPWNYTCGWPPRNKGTNVSPSEDASSAAKGRLCPDGVSSCGPGSGDL